MFRSTRQLVCIAALVGCATYSDRTVEVRDSVDQGDLESALVEIDRFLKAKSGGDPRRWNSNTALGVLERATLLQALGRYEQSARDFQIAEKRLELLDLSKDGGDIGKYIYSDSATNYRTPPSERLALNGFNMANYLARGDANGARVESRRLTTMRRYLDDSSPDHAQVAFSSYLAGFTCEALGEHDAALRYYNEALATGGLRSLAPVIARLAQRSRFRSERLAPYIPLEGSVPTEAATESETAGGELLVIVGVGRVPSKVPVRLPIGAAIGLAGTYITGDPTILAYTAFKVVTFPALERDRPGLEYAHVRIDGKPADVELVSDLEAEIVREWEELQPRIIGAAITRMITRALAAEGARAAGQQAEGAGAVVGLLAAFAVEGALVALDKPDTRSWTLMPGRVFLARARVAPGEHRVDVQMRGAGVADESWSATANVAAGRFAAVAMTSLR